jgi:hypothetical protein
MEMIQFELRETFSDTVAELMEEYDIDNITDEQFIVAVQLCFNSIA